MWWKDSVVGAKLLGKMMALMKEKQMETKIPIDVVDGESVGNETWVRIHLSS